MLVQDFEGSLGVCQGDEAWKRERKHCIQRLRDSQEPEACGDWYIDGS